jgi:hypothetical protein
MGKHLAQAVTYGQEAQSFQLETYIYNHRSALGEADRLLLWAQYYATANQYDKLIQLLEEDTPPEQVSLALKHWAAWQFFGQQPVPHAPMRWINEVVREEGGIAARETKAALKLSDNKPEAARAVAEQALEQADSAEQHRLKLLLAIIDESSGNKAAQQ